MRHPRTHRFLAWAGPSLVGAVAGFVALVAALAPTYPGVKKWGEDWFDALEPVVATPWFVALMCLLVVAYFAMLLWTSQPKPERSVVEASRKRKQEAVLDALYGKRREPHGDLHDTTDHWSARDEEELQRRKQREAERGYSEEWDWQAAKQEGRIRVERDKRLSEALAFAGLGSWGKEFIEAVQQGLGASNVPLRKFQQLAYDGALRVWGKSDPNRDLYEEIPREHWKTHQVEWFDLLRGKARTESIEQGGHRPYYDLMVSRAEFEAALPYVKSDGPPDL